MKSSSPRPRWLLPIVLIGACLNPQPDDTPLAIPSERGPDMAAGTPSGGGAVTLTPPSEDLVDREPNDPQVTPPAIDGPDGNFGADAGVPPADAGPDGGDEDGADNDDQD